MSHKPLDLALIREGDALMREARRLNPDVRMPSSFELERMILPMAKTNGNTGGRPTGEPTVAVALRIPQAMCDALDTYVQHLEAQTGLKASRTEICRHALRLFLQERSAPDQANRPKRPRKPAKATKG